MKWNLHFSSLLIGLLFPVILPFSLHAQTFLQRTLSPASGKIIYSLSIAPDGTILMGTKAGLHRSFDNGISWHYNSESGGKVIRSAIADSAGRLFIIAGEGGEPFNKIYRSEDGGSSWQIIFAGINCSAILSVTNEILLIASNNGIYRSIDHGNSWNNVNMPPATGPGAYSLCMTEDGIIYAGTYTTIIRSTNQGESWTVCFTSSDYNTMIATGNFGEVFTFSMAKNGHAYLYRSIDRGNTWNKYYPEYFESGVTFVLENGVWVQYGPGSYHLTGIVKDFYNRSYIVYSNGKDSLVFMGTNGKIIQGLEVENPDSYSEPMVITRDGHLLFCSDILYRSSKAIASPSIPLTKISQVLVDADHDSQPDSLGKIVTIYGVVDGPGFQTNEGILYTIQDGTGGIQLFKNTTGGVNLKLGDAVAVTGTIGYEHGTTQILPASFNDSNVKIIDSNQVLTKIPITLQQYLANQKKYENQIVSVAGIAKKPGSADWPNFGESANMIFWNGWDTLTVHIDKNANLSGDPEPAYPANVTGVVLKISSPPFNQNDEYQLSPNYFTDFESGVRVPPNPHFPLNAPTNGALWEIDSASQKFLFKWNNAVDLNKDKTLYQWIPVGSSAVTTLNGGADTFLVRTGTQLLALMGNNDTTVLKWSVQTRGATSEPIIKNVDTFSVILVKGKPLSVQKNNNMLPSVYSLSQNYPNPFNPSTKIEYQLPASSNVEMKVLDILGREIATLVNETKSAGTYSVEWNASQFPSGMYFYRMQAGNFVQIKKLLLLK